MPCSDDTTHDLWNAFHTHQTADIRVPRAALAELLACDGNTPSGLVVTAPREGSQSVLVNRDTLFRFMVAHGNKRCDAPAKGGQ